MTKRTYNLAFAVVLAAAVGRRQRRRAFFEVPGPGAMLRGTADRQGVDAVCVAVTAA